VLSDVVAIYAMHVHGLVMGFEGWRLDFVNMKNPLIYLGFGFQVSWLGLRKLSLMFHEKRLLGIYFFGIVC
jgi:hypothetical protein